MKKYLFITLLVLITLCMFVSCDGSVNNKLFEKELPQSVSFKRTDIYYNYVITLNNNEGKTGTYTAFFIFQGSEIPQTPLDITFDATGVITFDDSLTMTFYKSENTDDSISSMEELFISLSDIYAYEEGWLKFSKVVE